MRILTLSRDGVRRNATEPPSSAPAVLRHRVVTNFAAEAADRTSEDIVRELVGGKAWLGG